MRSEEEIRERLNEDIELRDWAETHGRPTAVKILGYDINYAKWVLNDQEVIKCATKNPID